MEKDVGEETERDLRNIFSENMEVGELRKQKLAVPSLRAKELDNFPYILHASILQTPMVAWEHLHLHELF